MSLTLYYHMKILKINSSHPESEILKLVSETILNDGIIGYPTETVYGLGADFPLLGQDCFFDYRFTIGWNTLDMPTFPGEPPAPLRNQNYTFTLGMYL